MFGGDRPTQKSDDKGQSPEARVDSLPSLDVDPVALAREAIQFHEKRDNSRSYLGRAVSFVMREDERSLARLKDLTVEYDTAVKAGDEKAAQKAREELTKQIAADRKTIERQDEFAHHGAGFLKAAGLFMRGKAGFLGTAAAYALDQMNPNDSFGVQALDGGLGLAKGAALKGMFHKLGQAPVGIAAKGVGIGVSARLLELGLTRQTYLSADGSYSLGKGLSSLRSTGLSKEMLLTDVVVFGVAHGLVKGANAATLGAVERSPLASTMLTASSFGLLSGSSAEVHHQLSQGKTLETLDYAKIARAGAVRGAIDLFAGVPGGLQARAAMTPPVESIRQAGEKRSIARQLAADTSPLGIGSPRLSVEFFSRLGKAVSPEAGTAQRAQLFRFLTNSPEVQPGVRRFAELHPDIGVKQVIEEFFQQPGVRLAGSTETGMAGVRQAPGRERVTPAGKKDGSALPEPEMAHVSAPERGQDGPRDVQKLAPGVFTSSREGELWMPERDITKLTPEYRVEMVEEVRTPMLDRGRLERLSDRITEVASRWQVDMTGQQVRVAKSREVYDEAVRQVQERIIDEDVIHINELYNDEVAPVALAPFPEHLAIYKRYVAARELHGQRIGELNEVLRARSRDLENAVNAFAASENLPSIRLKVVEELNASATYRMGNGEVRLKQTDLFNAEDTAGLVDKLAHEFTHAEQDRLVIQRLADSQGIGTTPTQAQFDRLIETYSQTFRSAPSKEWFARVLARRQGRVLSVDEAARADEMIEAYKINRSPSDVFERTGNHFRIARRELAKLDQMNSGYLLVSRLGSDRSGVLVEHLFGSKTAPPEIEALNLLRKKFEQSDKVEWPELKIRAWFKNRLQERMEQLNEERRQAYTEYMAGLHEREAWVVGERARLIAQSKGATRREIPQKRARTLDDESREWNLDDTGESAIEWLR